MEQIKGQITIFEDSRFEVCDTEGNIMGSSFTELDDAINYALEYGGEAVNEVFFEILDSELGRGLEGETTAVETVWIHPRGVSHQKFKRCDLLLDGEVCDRDGNGDECPERWGCIEPEKTRSANQIIEDIRKNFKGDLHENTIVLYYAQNLQGCEECDDQLCYECLSELRRFQHKLNDLMFSEVVCRECGTTGDFDNNGHCRSCEANRED